MSRRKESRIFVDIAGRCHLPGGAVCAAYISDLSANGCHLSMDDHDLEAGDRIQIELSAAGAFPAEVRWIKCEQDRISVGAQFDVPIHPALLVHFAAWCRMAG